MVLAALGAAEFLAAAGAGWILWKLAKSSAGGHDPMSMHHDTVAMDQGMARGPEISLRLLSLTVLVSVLVRRWPDRPLSGPPRSRDVRWPQRAMADQEPGC
ncbi:hypothetical protein CH281_18670 [Rhodococcus sp. 06-221-2]|nr:hypothetical protein CH281_18670 [Rhodococcus sp. 06-221-2]